ncbi:MAG: hypothetical protein ACSHW2_07510 [Parasphingopyxis sp.]
MIALVKALIPGAILSLAVSLFVGSGGSRGGFLNVHQVTLAGYDFHWSWPLFLVGTALAWAILLMMD